MKKVIFTVSAALLAVMFAVVLTGCLCSPSSVECIPEPPYYTCEDGEEIIAPTDYSSYIGMWQGYAIAVTNGLVITDVERDNVEFYFLYTSSIDGSITTSEVHTLPIEDNQIRVVKERIGYGDEEFEIAVELTFHDEHISWFQYIASTSGDALIGPEYGTEWMLTRVANLGGE